MLDLMLPPGFCLIFYSRPARTSEEDRRSRLGWMALGSWQSCLCRSLRRFCLCVRDIRIRHTDLNSSERVRNRCEMNLLITNILHSVLRLLHGFHEAEIALAPLLLLRDLDDLTFHSGSASYHFIEPQLGSASNGGPLPRRRISVRQGLGLSKMLAHEKGAPSRQRGYSPNTT